MFEFSTQYAYPVLETAFQYRTCALTVKAGSGSDSKNLLLGCATGI